MQVIVPPGKGRRPAPLFYNITRHLSETDIAALWEGRKDGTAARLKTLRYNHHLLAKAVASGKSLIECSNLTGLSGTRISDLKNDPAFQELVAYYAEEMHEVYVDVHQRMAALGTSILEELSERFEADPEKFTKRELMDLFTTMADRSIATAKGGPSPQQALQVAGAAGGLALQINFVSPTGEAPKTLDLTPHAPAAQTGVPQSAPLALDGEPLDLAPATPYPSQEEIAKARFEEHNRQIDEREQFLANLNNPESAKGNAK